MAPQSFKGFKAALEKHSNRDQVVERDQVARTAEQTIMSGPETIKTTLTLPQLPQPLRIQETPVNVAPSSDTTDAINDEPLPKSKTQTSETLEEFQEKLPTLLQHILDHEASPNVGQPCACQVPNANRTTRCYDCQFYEISCSDCFIRSHANLPTHWAEVWDSDRGFFVRHDIATLKPDISSINLGHAGLPCLSRYATNLVFHVIDTNGIHTTKIRFCICKGNPNRVDQLMRARLFPATINQPTTAFSFQVLHQFHIHHLESKESAYDFIGSLRRLTDNAFPQHIADPSSQFRMVMRIWRLLTAMKRSGQAHGIDSYLTHRREGNLIVHCPACPDPHINMEPGWERTPDDLGHLQQTQLTADGNHHSNKYRKNTDPDDISLYEGKAYFPNDLEYREYVKNLPKNIPEKLGDCDHLNALNKQDRKKFKNMDITGIVCIQCSHIFIKSTVDLQLGEKFTNTDYAISHVVMCRLRPEARSRAKPGPKKPGQAGPKRLGSPPSEIYRSYDIACGFSVNAASRFEEKFPEELDFIEGMTWLIPLVHVQNHKDNCTYLFSSAYIKGAGHFHGETAEMPWVELNQLAPQTRQMNNGHRQDTIIDHHSHWNWAKTSNMAATLYNEVERAKELFLEKHATFKTLCALYADKVTMWNQMDRRPRMGDDREVQSVYRQNEKKVPSQSRIYHSLLAELKSMPKPTLQITVPSFLNEALLISANQREILARIKASKTKSELPASLEDLRDRLRNRIDNWHKLQKDIMPQVGDVVAQQAISGKFADSPEREVLYIPSDFSVAQRIKYGLIELGEHERRFHEGAAYDSVVKVRILRKSVDAMRRRKKKQDRGQQNNTRSSGQIHDLEAIRDLHIDDYSAARSAMISLGLSPNDPTFPPLTLDDTFRKPTHLKRAVGDSRMTDGRLWTMTGVTGGTRRVGSSSAAGPSTSRVSPSQVFGTQIIQKKHGWIWRFKPGKKMSDEELQEWMDDGDRVQWFRTEAEMQRWREEWEFKQADFMRTIATFQRMSSVWGELSTISSTPGPVAYANKQSAMYQEMERRAKELFSKAGYSHLIDLDDRKILADYIREERAKEEYLIPELSNTKVSTHADTQKPMIDLKSMIA
ncbi:hypothetical protein BDZ97DRAFT_1968746 [Flammula alnicola]|nr:hypothetical protein BDZ97DRAFT_1968746 [Flammula alnicola]